MVAHRPDAPFLGARAIDEHRVSVVDAARDVGVAAGSEHGGGAGVGIDASEVVRRQREATLRVVDAAGVVQEEGAPGLREAAFVAAEDQGAELERCMDVLEEYFRFSKSNRPPILPVVDRLLKKRAAVLSA